MALDIDIRLPRQHYTLSVGARLPQAGVVGVTGPSGSGKSSLLRALAGIEPGTQGRVALDRQAWLGPHLNLPPERRRVALVTQHPSLFRHLSPLENLLFGYRRVRADQRLTSPDQVIELLGLAPLLPLATHQLSGGQQQRLMLGRALLSSPRLLLLDEPVSALDSAAHGELLEVMVTHARALGIPALLVSHHCADLARHADHLLALDRGRLILCCSAKDPAAQRMLGPDHVISVLRGQGNGSKPGEIRLEGSPVQHLALATEHSDVLLYVRAQDIVLSLVPDPYSSLDHRLDVVVRHLVPSGTAGQQRVELDCSGQSLVTFVSDAAADRMLLHPGLRLSAQCRAFACAPALPRLATRAHTGSAATDSQVAADLLLPGH